MAEPEELLDRLNDMKAMANSLTNAKAHLAAAETEDLICIITHARRQIARPQGAFGGGLDEAAEMEASGDWSKGQLEDALITITGNRYHGTLPGSGRNCTPAEWSGTRTARMNIRQREAMQRVLIHEAIGKLRAVQELFGVEDNAVNNGMDGFAEYLEKLARVRAVGI